MAVAGLLNAAARPIVVAMLALGLALPAFAEPPADASPGADGPKTLLDAWLAFPKPHAAAPYAFIRADQSDKTLDGLREDLNEEFKSLRFWLSTSGYDSYAKSVDEWQASLAESDRSRVPGQWSAAYLLAHPNHSPPLERVAAIGVCEVPDYVRVWSPVGYDQLPWRSGLRLSDLYHSMPSLRDTSTAFIAVVSPTGEVDRYGTQSWNYADTELAPGAAVIGSLRLKGAVFDWMQMAIANYVAHTVSGVNCTEQTITEQPASVRVDD